MEERPTVWVSARGDHGVGTRGAGTAGLIDVNRPDVLNTAEAAIPAIIGRGGGTYCGANLARPPASLGS